MLTLAGLDFERWAPRYVLVEAIDEERRRALEKVLEARYEMVEQLSPLDLLLRLRES